MRIVKSKEERKREILDVGKTIFLEKGFDKTTMEDIIAKTSLSKGGVYYYYSNTTDILYDLMIEGSAYRYKIIKHFKEKEDKEWDLDMVCEQMVEKMLDESEYMSLYVIYLQASQNNKRLKKLFKGLKEENIRMMGEYFNNENKKLVDVLFGDFFISFINAIILASEILDAREIFRLNRSIIFSMVKLIISKIS